MLEAKLVVLQFQIKIKEQLELIASSLENMPGGNESLPNDFSARSNLVVEDEIARSAQEKAKELSLELKSITQLYNDYAVPFKLWEVWTL